MPYRRLPNTDQARIQSLSKAVEQGEQLGYLDLPYAYSIHTQAVNLLSQMERAGYEYQIAYDRQVDFAKEYQKCMKMAKLYVSHFIQVFQLAVIRGEIKQESKSLYHLPLNSHAVPEINTEAALLLWGERVVNGEKLRMEQGAAPIYNPSIAKVRVFYDNFVNARNTKNILQANTRRAMLHLDDLHEAVDALILEIWNAVEGHYKHLPLEERLESCRKFGINYYYRKGEKAEDND